MIWTLPEEPPEGAMVRPVTWGATYVRNDQGKWHPLNDPAYKITWARLLEMAGSAGLVEAFPPRGSVQIQSSHAIGSRKLPAGMRISDGVEWHYYYENNGWFSWGTTERSESGRENLQWSNVAIPTPKD